MVKLSEEELLFKTYLDRIHIELNYTYMHFIVLKTIDIFMEKYQSELRIGDEFWGLTRQSHFFDVVIRLNKICDNHQDALSIDSLLNFAEKNLKIFSEENFIKRNPYSNYNNVPIITRKSLESHRRKYQSFPQSNLRRLRNKVLTHIDKTTVEQNYYPFAKWTVEVQEMEAIINSLIETIDLLEMAFEKSRYLPGNSFIEKGMYDTIELIRSGLAENKSETS